MSKKKNATQDDVWNEKLGEVNVRAHWAYLFGVLGGGFLAMIALIAALGGGA
ncbi:MAG TPA: hypothetical protein VN240_01500 [Propylenella sp.]|nr:hypothetical protein [Propylenella sp.]